MAQSVSWKFLKMVKHRVTMWAIVFIPVYLFKRNKNTCPHKHLFE